MLETEKRILEEKIQWCDKKLKKLSFYKDSDNKTKAYLKLLEFKKNCHICCRRIELLNHKQCDSDLMEEDNDINDLAKVCLLIYNNKYISIRGELKQLGMQNL